MSQSAQSLHRCGVLPCANCVTLGGRIEALEAEVARLREALASIAEDSSHWRCIGTARAALGQPDHPKPDILEE